MPKNGGKYIKFKNLEGKIKSPFKIFAEFESILVPEHNGKQNPNEGQTNKYQKHVGCSYGYKLELWIMFNSLFERRDLKLGCNA